MALAAVGDPGPVARVEVALAVEVAPAVVGLEGLVGGVAVDVGGSVGGLALATAAALPEGLPEQA